MKKKYRHILFFSALTFFFIFVFLPVYTIAHLVLYRVIGEEVYYLGLVILALCGPFLVARSISPDTSRPVSDALVYSVGGLVSVFLTLLVLVLSSCLFLLLADVDVRLGSGTRLPFPLIAAMAAAGEVVFVFRNMAACLLIALFAGLSILVSRVIRGAQYPIRRTQYASVLTALMIVVIVGPFAPVMGGRDLIFAIATKIHLPSLCYLSGGDTEGVVVQEGRRQLTQCLDQADPQYEQNLKDCTLRDNQYNLNCKDSKSQAAAQSGQSNCEALYPGVTGLEVIPSATIIMKDGWDQVQDVPQNNPAVSIIDADNMDNEDMEVNMKNAQRYYIRCVSRNRTFKATQNNDPTLCIFKENNLANATWSDWQAGEHYCLAHFVGSIQWQVSCRERARVESNPSNTMRRNCCLPRSGDLKIWNNQTVDLSQFDSNCVPIY